MKNHRDRGSSGKRIGLLSLFIAMAWWPLLEGALSEETAAPQPVSEETAAPKPVFATVDGQTISGEAFEKAVQNGIRQKFYHGQIPQPELLKFRREVGEKLVDRLLLLKEAERRGLKANQEEINQVIAQYDKRYADSEQWRQNREKMLGTLTQDLAEQSLLKQLEQQARNIPEPTDAAVRTYFTNHPEKFTKPEERKLSVILLRVDASSGGGAWESARQEAITLIGKLKGGADFAELARLHSGDLTADSGGDMGVVHKNSLAATAEEAINKLAVGQITDPPVMVLEGMAIFRLEAVFPSRAMAYDDVKVRATKLLAQESSEQAWEGLKQQLRAGKQIKIDQQYFEIPK